MVVIIYKTNIIDITDVKKLSKVFSEQVAIQRWNVDTEDIDKVLRIEARHDISFLVRDLVTTAGYWCEELTD